KCSQGDERSSDNPAFAPTALLSNHWRSTFACLAELLRHLGIAKVLGVEIYDRDARSMFHLAFAKIVQMSFPMAILLEIFSHMLGDENVTRVTAIHHSLRDIDSSSGNVRATTYVHYAADRSAVNPHTQLEFGVLPRPPTNLQSAFHRGLRSIVEHERHSISCWHGNEPTICLRRAKMFRLAHDPIKQLEQSSLLVSYEFRVTDDVDEE